MGQAMTKAEQSQETYRRILETTRELFADHGYEATGVARICQEAGVSKGAFYHHFPSKQAVLQAILDDWLLALQPGLSLWADNTAPAPEALRRSAQAAEAVFRGDVRTRRLLLEFWNLAGREPLVADAARDPFRRYAEGLAGLLRRGSAEGSLKPIDAEAGARLLVSLAMGVLLSSLLDPTGADWGRVLRESIPILLDGIAKEI